eukprot:440709_1
MLPVLRTLCLAGVDIWTQLCIEEALFYCTNSNWLVLNSPKAHTPPVIVLGISGKPHLMCNLDAVERKGVPLLRRFSGGGTVVVDDSTFFSTLIINANDVSEVPPYPRGVCQWAGSIYESALTGVIEDGGPKLTLREHDFVFGNLKFGGNAQAITKGRCLHHTSFLWDYSVETMRLLKIPEKRPQYRKDRHHENFLTSLSNHVRPDVKEDRSLLNDAVIESLNHRFQVDAVSNSELKCIIEGLGGMEKWAGNCRTRHVGPDGKPLKPQPTLSSKTYPLVCPLSYQ